MSRCKEFYDKWEKEPNWCEKCGEAVRTINNYLDLVNELETRGVERKTTIVGISEGSARPLFSIKDPIIKEKVIEKIKNNLNGVIIEEISQNKKVGAGRGNKNKISKGKGRGHKTKINSSDVKKIIDEVVKENKPPSKALPDKKYNVIYADPPWDIGSFVLDKWESPLEDKYPTMSIHELKNMKIEQLKNDNCVLFMWSTLTTIPEALELMNIWGFKYHIMLTWDKGNGWSSTGFHRKSEVILVGYVGKITEVINQTGEYIPTVFYETKTKHSKKPDIMYKYLLSNTIGKKIELFAREKRDGFEVWGNEV